MSKAKTPFVSFKAVKQSVSMAQVLDHYGLMETLVPRGRDSLTGPCPIHHGTNPTQFRVSPAKNIWNCFGGCPGGNVLDFVAQMEKVDIREAALRLVEWFGPPAAGGPQGVPETPSKAPEVPKVPEPTPATVREEAPEIQEPAVITANAPLPFALKKGL
jgi:DNA primase